MSRSLSSIAYSPYIPSVREGSITSQKSSHVAASQEPKVLDRNSASTANVKEHSRRPSRQSLPHCASGNDVSASHTEKSGSAYFPSGSSDRLQSSSDALLPPFSSVASLSGRVRPNPRPPAPDGAQLSPFETPLQSPVGSPRTAYARRWTSVPEQAKRDSGKGDAPGWREAGAEEGGANTLPRDRGHSLFFSRVSGHTPGAPTARSERSEGGRRPASSRSLGGSGEGDRAARREEGRDRNRMNETLLSAHAARIKENLRRGSRDAETGDLESSTERKWKPTEALESDGVGSDLRQESLKHLDRRRDSAADCGGGVSHRTRKDSASPGTSRQGFAVGDHLPPSASARLYSALLESDVEFWERKSRHLKELLDQKDSLLQQARAELGKNAGRQSNEFRELVSLKEALERRREELVVRDARVRELERENEELLERLEASRRAAASREEDFKRLERRSEDEFRQSAETRFRLQKECDAFQTELTRLRTAYTDLERREGRTEEREKERDRESLRLETTLQSTRSDLEAATARLSETHEQLQASRQYICYLERLIRDLRFFVVYHLELEKPQETSTAAAPSLPSGPVPLALECPDRSCETQEKREDGKVSRALEGRLPDSQKATKKQMGIAHKLTACASPPCNGEGELQGLSLALQRPEELTSHLVCTALLPGAASTWGEKHAVTSMKAGPWKNANSVLQRRVADLKSQDKRDEATVSPSESTALVAKQVEREEGGACSPLDRVSASGQRLRDRDSERASAPGISRLPQASGEDSLALYRNLKLPELTKRRLELEHLELRLEAERQAVDAALRVAVREVPTFGDESALPTLAEVLQEDVSDPRFGEAKRHNEELTSRLRTVGPPRMHRFEEDSFPVSVRSSKADSDDVWREPRSRERGGSGTSPQSLKEREENKVFFEGVGGLDSLEVSDERATRIDETPWKREAENTDPALAYLDHLIACAQQDIKGSRGEKPTSHSSRRTAGLLRRRLPFHASSPLNDIEGSSSDSDLHAREEGSSRFAGGLSPLGRPSSLRFFGDSSDAEDALPSAVTSPLFPQGNRYAFQRENNNLKFRGVGVPPLSVQSKARTRAERRSLLGVSAPQSSAESLPHRKRPWTPSRGRGISPETDSEVDAHLRESEFAAGLAPRSACREVSFPETLNSSIIHGDGDPSTFRPQAQRCLLSPRAPWARGGRAGSASGAFGTRRDREKDLCSPARQMAPCGPPAVVKRNGEAVLNAPGAAARLAEELGSLLTVGKAKHSDRAVGSRDGTPIRPRWKVA
ncbi:hypothetical protein TGRUB_271090 [Toxoplasma gondii RUB]|uniref:Uncharacterized protein n=1 Tax=Toxoplasma gondii RUB TaxID=935652 RepID=A0A086LYF4_TOXGO|nr:hypothetical protein TGRUB_271090 [Toxoplasma gondii RUB]